jgi:hypothetical protein
MVRRPLTDAAFTPVLVDTEHGYVAPVPGFSVGALFADYTADGGVRTFIGVSLYRASVERTFARR